jgi:hypothetical protein
MSKNPVIQNVIHDRQNPLEYRKEIPLINRSNSTRFLWIKSKAVPVRGREGPYGCETSRLPHFLDNRLTNSCEVVSLMRQPPFTPQEDSWHSFLLEAELTPGP